MRATAPRESGIPSPERSRRSSSSASRPRSARRSKRPSGTARSRASGTSGPAAAPGAEDADPLVLEAPHGERERVLGGRIEPVDVIDREQDRLLRGEAAQQPEQAQADRALERLGALGLGAQQRDLERAALRRRQVRHGRLGHVGEQVAERGVGELRLALDRPAAQDPQPVARRRTPGPDSRAPSCRCPISPSSRSAAGPEPIAPRNSSTRASSASRPMSAVCATFANSLLPAAHRTRASTPRSG